jgi:OOP family OmpA-OmpF porin
MSVTLRALHRAAFAAALGSCGCMLAPAVMAQSNSTFVGINVGKPSYSTSCGNVSGLSCSNNGTSVSLTAGDMLTRNWGAELSLLDLGKADRGGGTVDARGINVSVVGRVPVVDWLDVEGKLGTTWGVTHVNANPASGVQNGRDSGFGLGYGVALGMHMGHGFTASAGWEQHDFHFIGQGTSEVKNITLGVAYTF